MHIWGKCKGIPIACIFIIPCFLYLEWVLGGMKKMVQAWANHSSDLDLERITSHDSSMPPFYIIWTENKADYILLTSMLPELYDFPLTDCIQTSAL